MYNFSFTKHVWGQTQLIPNLIVCVHLLTQINGNNWGVF